MSSPPRMTLRGRKTTPDYAGKAIDEAVEKASSDDAAYFKRKDAEKAEKWKAAQQRTQTILSGHTGDSVPMMLDEKPKDAPVIRSKANLKDFVTAQYVSIQSSGAQAVAQPFVLAVKKKRRGKFNALLAVQRPPVANMDGAVTLLQTEGRKSGRVVAKLGKSEPYTALAPQMDDIVRKRVKVSDSSDTPPTKAAKLTEQRAYQALNGDVIRAMKGQQMAQDYDEHELGQIALFASVQRFEQARAQRDVLRNPDSTEKGIGGLQNIATTLKTPTPFVDRYTGTEALFVGTTAKGLRKRKADPGGYDSDKDLTP